jgi:hypothetical protein
MAKRASKAAFHRLCEWAREEGFPVEKMGVFVDGPRMALLPPGAGPMEPAPREDGANEWDEVLPGAA